MPASRAETLMLAHAGRDDSILGRSAQLFAREVYQLSGGEVRIEVVGNGVFGREPEMLNIARYGKADLVLVSYGLKSVIPEFAILDLPFLVRERRQIPALDEEFVKPVLDPIAKEHALKIVGFWEHDFRHIASSHQPIVTPEDLRGATMRVSSERWTVRTFESWGARAVALPFAELVPALQRGVIAGSEVTVDWLSSFDDLQHSYRFLSLTRHRFQPAVLVAGQERWSQLPRELLIDAARRTRDQLIEEAERREREMIARLDVEVIEPEIDWFRKESLVVYDEFAREVPRGGELLGRAISSTNW
jgi:TRAP-type C4-dicarboxylate transport system substrate-binding protein